MHIIVSLHVCAYFFIAVGPARPGEGADRGTLPVQMASGKSFILEQQIAMEVLKILKQQKILKCNSQPHNNNELANPNGGLHLGIRLGIRILLLVVLVLLLSLLLP